jgi:hypothetical protein
MGTDARGESHNAPDNMATNSPKRPAVANNASFAMQYWYPSGGERTPSWQTHFYGAVIATAWDAFGRQPPVLPTEVGSEAGCEAPDPSAGASLSQPPVPGVRIGCTAEGSFT